ncbi:isochorismatase family cysteine hydrolase [Streptomyces sp. NPDC048430]|uniref:cysteine hydrolase family protein n=1 Tax=Streptomyces sp. NPDC048430 TaxID=3155388 RepID=UPI00341BBE4F
MSDVKESGNEATQDWVMDGKPALVLMHMQNGIAELFPQDRISGMIERQRELLDAFRSRDLPVVFVNVIPNPMGKLPAYGQLMKGIKKLISDTAMLDDPDFVRAYTTTIPEMERRPDEPVLINWLLGAFTNSGLDLLLRQRDVKTVVLSGFATQSAVYTAAVQATDLWYSTVIPRDASITGGRTAMWPDLDEKEKHQRIEEVTLDVMGAQIALVTSTPDVIAHLP